MSSIMIPATFPRRSSRDVAAGELAAWIRADNGPIELQDTRVRGEIRLQSREFNHRLVLRNVVFDGLVDLRDNHFSNTVDLRDCEFRNGLILEGSRIRGSLIMARAVLHRIPGDPGGKSARFHLLRVDGDFLGKGLCFHAQLDLSRCAIRGHLDLSSAAEECVCTGDLLLQTSRVGGNVGLSGLRLKGSVRADASTVGANFSLGPLHEGPAPEDGLVRHGASVSGNVTLVAARVTGDATFSAAEIGGEIDLQAAEVRGGLFCRAVQGIVPVVRGRFHAPAVRISATLDLSGANVKGDVILEGAQVTGNVICLDGWHVPDGKPAFAPELSEQVLARDPDLRTCIGGVLNLSHAAIAGSLEARDVCIDQSLRFDSASLKGWVSLSRSRIGDHLLLESARIMGGLYCQSLNGIPPIIGERLLAASANGGHPAAIKAAAAQIFSGVHLSGIQVRGDADFTGARIEGSVEIENRSDPSWPVHASARPAPAAAASLARVSGTLDFAHAKVIGSMKLTGLQVERGIVLEAASVSGYLDLSDARIAPDADPAEYDTDGAEPGAPTPLARARGRTGSLNAKGVRVTGEMRCHGMSVLGNVDLQSARIDGGLNCCALVVDSAGVGDRPVIGGAVLLGGATIGPHADFRAAWIGGDMGLERACITGMLRLRLAAPRPRPLWRERLAPRRASAPPEDEVWRKHLCTRLGRIPVSEAAGPGAPRTESRARAAVARLGTLISPLLGTGWRKRLHSLAERLDRAVPMRRGEASVEPPAVLDLRNCTVEYLDLQGMDVRENDTKKTDRCAANVSIRLEGCKFHELSVPGQDYLFLFRRPDGAGFRQSNYEVLERWLRNQGNEQAAERVFRRMRAERRATLPLLKQPGHWVLGAFRDVAMGFQWLLLVFVMVLVVSTAVFQSPGAISFGREGGRGEAARPVSGDEAFFFALQAQLPMFRLPVVGDWKPARAEIRSAPLGLRVRYDQYTVLLSILGYVMVPLVIGGVASTLLQRRSAGK